MVVGQVGAKQHHLHCNKLNSHCNELTCTQQVMSGLVAHPMLRQAGRQASKQAGRQPPVEGGSHQTPSELVHLLLALVVGQQAGVGLPVGEPSFQQRSPSDPADPVAIPAASPAAYPAFLPSTPALPVLDQPARTPAGQLHLQGNTNKQHGVSGGVGGHT